MLLAIFIIWGLLFLFIQACGYKIFVGGIDHATTDADVRSYFSQYGEVSCGSIASKFYSRDGRDII